LATRQPDIGADPHVIIPCIDLQEGRAVQLVHGRKLRLAVKDVFGLLERFRDYPLLHVIDLDAAMGRGSNARLVGQLCRRAPMRVRVGGGIRTTARAKRILAAGAEKVIIGSAAFRNGGVNRDLLSRLAAAVGKKRIIVAVDTQGGRILVRGWQEKLRLTPDKVFPELEPYASEFLCTYVDAEGTMRGTSLRWFRQLRKGTQLPITAAGGIRSGREVRELERLGMNAAVGMALYLDRLR
jgi:phosphoribosylformimino-5-aminoimidazole carboxamide ribotide isomerase